jgi:hypothetical protein
MSTAIPHSLIGNPQQVVPEASVTAQTGTNSPAIHSEAIAAERDW